MVINVTLISHTNVGKTTLARTLLRRDIGKAIDQPHVTDTADPHLLAKTEEGDELWLWDTPGLGDSARLLKRLRKSTDPIGWLQTQVWDRFVDRPFYSSQMAMRSVRENCDVMLYLANAAEGPESAGYVGVEMQILGWMARPVLVLLNQTGQPRGRDEEAREESAWRDHLAAYPWVRQVLSLDAFTRCWIQEDKLLQAIGAALPPEKQESIARLRAEWRSRNLKVYADSMAATALLLARAATDSEVITTRGWNWRFRKWFVAVLTKGESASLDADLAEAMNQLGKRLDTYVRESTNALIQLHGLTGEAAEQISDRVAAQLTVDKGVDPAKAGLLGAALAGALGGLAADLAAGGLTLGAGAAVGTVLGLLGAAGAAKAYNLSRGGDDGRVRWSPEFLTQRVEPAVLRYLAVAHFGRGRGQWIVSECPPQWAGVVSAAIAPYRKALDDLWATAQRECEASTTKPSQALIDSLHAVVDRAVRDVLAKLYPDAVAVFGDRAKNPTDF